MSEGNGRSELVDEITFDLTKPETALEAIRAQCADGEYADAIDLVQTALEHFEDADVASRAALHNLLATAQQAVGEIERSAKSAEAAITLLEEATGTHGAELGVALHTRALAHLHEGNIDEATTLLDRAAQALDDAGPEARVDFCSVLLTMAEVASASGESGGAQALAERVIGEMTSIQPSSEEHAAHLNRVTAKAFLCLGSALAQGGAADDAKDFLARAIEFFDAGFGHGHPEMTAGLEAVAGIYRALGDEDAAAVIDEELAVVGAQRGDDDGQLVN